MSDLGKIVLTDGGTWDNEVEYEILTMVRHNKASYYSVQQSIGQEPSETSEYWRLIAKDGNEVTVDSELSETSENPVQNKVVNTAIAALGAAVIISATAPSQTANVLWVKPGGSA